MQPANDNTQDARDERIPFRLLVLATALEEALRRLHRVEITVNTRP